MALAASAQAQNECRPELPVPGNWVAGTGQASTIAGAGGAAQAFQGRLDVEACGTVVVFSRPGVPTSPVVFTKTGPDTFFNQDPNHRASTIEGQFVDQRNFQGLWSYTLTANSPFYMSYVSTDATEPDDATLTKAVCSCPGFKQELQSWIRDAESIRDLYQDPRFNSDPKARFPKRWQTAVMSRILDAYMETDVFEKGITDPKQVNAAYEEALKKAEAELDAVIDPKTGHLRPDVDQSKLKAMEQGSRYAVAWTDVKTCAVGYQDSDKQCYPSLFEQMSRRHENVHVAACQAQNKVHRDHYADLARGKGSTTSTDKLSYAFRTQVDVAWAAAEEVRAYNTEIKWLRDWYAAQCDGAL
ncbi:MAG: hypothetical protein AAFR93_14425 [Pseudomonadota bacterium]